MIARRCHRSAAAVAAALAFPGCMQISTEPVQPPGQAVVALLPDAPGGGVGAATVRNDAGSVALETARAATRIVPGAAPSAPSVLSEDEVQALFGGALGALPPEPVTFTLFFQFESEALTPESRALLEDTLRAVKARPVPDVHVIGHTDTTGAAPANFGLGLRRAQVVRTLLLDTGLAASAVTVASHGESQLLVATADDVYEPRNRRVTITVR